MDNTISEDPNIISAIAPYQEKTLGYTSTVIGQATGEYSGEGQTVTPTAIMELINKVQAQSANTQLSIAAPLSDTAKIPQGNITIKDIMGTYVYENYLYGIKMTGGQLKKWLEYSARYYKQVASETDPIEKDKTLNIPDYNLDQLYGTTYDIDLTKPVGSRIVNLKYQGRLIKDTDIFTVAINDYRYNGGGGFMAAAGLSNTDPSIVTYSSAKALGDDGQVRSLMISYIRNNKSISPTCSGNWNIYTKNVAVDNSGTSSLGSSSSHHSHSDNSSDSSTSSNTSEKNQQVGQTSNVVKNNWNQVNGRWYYMNEQGEKLTSTWKQVNNKWYYLDKDGSMKIGWFQDNNGKWYYLQDNGAMKTGWMLGEDNQWYYLNTDGSMMTGWFKDSDGKWYYLESSGAMAKNKYISDYYVNEKGEWVV